MYFANTNENAKASHHHYGTTTSAGKRLIPKREFFALSIDDIAKIENIVDEHIAKAIMGNV